MPGEKIIMNISKLHEELEIILLNLLERNPYLDEDEPFANIDFIEVRSHLHHKWCWIVVKGRCSYDTESSYSDYSSYVNVRIEYSWIGLREELPADLSMESLADWSLYKTKWKRKIKKSELQYHYTHEGTLVKDISRYRNISIQTSNGVDETKDGNERWLFNHERVLFDSLKAP